MRLWGYLPHASMSEVSTPSHLTVSSVLVSCSILVLYPNLANLARVMRLSVSPLLAALSVSS